MPLASIPQRVQQEGEGSRGLAATRVPEMIARIGQTPVLEHAGQAISVDVRLHHALGQIREAKPGQSRAQDLSGPVEHELAVDAHLELATALLELPGVEPAMNRQS